MLESGYLKKFQGERDIMVRLAGIFKDGMVLQQNQRNRIWGEADAMDQKIFIKFADQILETTWISMIENTWEAYLPALPAGGPYTLQVGVGRREADITWGLELTDILIGEVWFAGGQSNMELELQNSEGGQEILQTTADADLRFYNVPKYAIVDEELQNLEANTSWKRADSDAICDVSAVAYHFGVKLREELNVPIGIIDCYWGGTSATCWVSEEALSDVPEVEPYLTEWQEECTRKSESTYRLEMDAYNVELEAWNRRVEALRAEDPDVTWEVLNVKAGRCPWPQPKGSTSPFRPFGLHESMVRRVAGYGIRGFIYYQGEEDWSRSSFYEKLNSAVIRQWRADFSKLDYAQILPVSDDHVPVSSSSELPFYLVQLPMYIEGGVEDDKNWCVLRQQQQMVTEQNENTACACIIDCGEYDNIHPTDKKTPGTRLALQALGRTYGEISEYDNMVPEFVSYEDAQVRIHLNNTYGEIEFRRTDGKMLTAKLDRCRTDAGKQNQRPAENGVQYQLPLAEANPGDIYGFELTEDGVHFVPAEVKVANAEDARVPSHASVSSDSLIVSNPDISHPTGVRYAYTNYGVANLYNRIGLPLIPFSDDKM